MKKGLLIVLSGPSGVGKGTVLSGMLKDESLNLSYSISMTTRARRHNEVQGFNYDFVTKERFIEAISNNELLEYAEFVGNYYGTPMQSVEALLNKGRNVILEIEVQGAMQVAKRCPEALTIFITPPSMEELESRIRKRATEAEEIIQQRLSKAVREMEMISQYKYVVCNDDPKLAGDIIALIIKRHMQIEDTES